MIPHIPVLLQEAITSLAIKKDGIYLDLTCGRAGHSEAILSHLEGGLLLCFDQDEEAIPYCQKRLEKLHKPFKIVKRNFMELEEVLAEEGIEKVDGILADLGVSSPQFDDPSRGFSYREDAPLDMRMDRAQRLDAKEVVNSYSLEALTRIFRDYGEDADAYKVAKAILRYRESKPIETTLELVDIIKSAKSSKTLAKKGHPAKQIFQAIRIEVNHEEEALEKLLEVGPKLLKQDGRLSIITFMSIDDRLVKQAFKKLAIVEGSRENLPFAPEIETMPYRLYSHKPIIPSLLELDANPRSSSAKLRTLIRN